MKSPDRLSETVVARIEGGLGNQLFQYAAAISLADRLGAPLGLDLRALASNGDRPFQLNLYKTRFRILSSEELDLLPEPRPNRWRRLSADLRRSIGASRKLLPFWPEGFEFDPRFEKISCPVYLVGYWQSERYFHGHRAALLHDLQLLNAPVTPHPMLRNIRASNSVALHIRRGDYVTNASAAQFHGLCDLAYYHDALELMRQRLESPEIFVFSDDLDWAREHLQTTLPMHFVEGHAPEQGYLDLELMRQCRHHVIANSSFSWWGAWLAESTSQIVCAPKRWFAAPDVNTDDVVPLGWIRL